MTDNQKKLLVLGAVDRTITTWAYRSLRVGDKFAYDADDLISEARLKVLEVCDHYQDKSMKEVISAAFISVINMFRSLSRRGYTERYDGIVVDLDSCFNLCDPSLLLDMFVDFGIPHLYSMLTTEEKLVLNLLIDPPEVMVVEAERRCGRDAEVKITLDMIGDCLGFSKCKVRRLMDKIRDAVPAAVDYASCFQVR
jgi:hypothetical protein